LRVQSPGHAGFARNLSHLRLLRSTQSRCPASGVKTAGFPPAANERLRCLLPSRTAYCPVRPPPIV
jgi:hypothetical protein